MTEGAWDARGRPAPSFVLSHHATDPIPDPTVDEVVTTYYGPTTAGGCRVKDAFPNGSSSYRPGTPTECRDLLYIRDFSYALKYGIRNSVWIGGTPNRGTVILPVADHPDLDAELRALLGPSNIYTFYITCQPEGGGEVRYQSSKNALVRRFTAGTLVCPAVPTS